MNRISSGGWPKQVVTTIQESLELDESVLGHELLIQHPILNNFLNP